MKYMKIIAVIQRNYGYNPYNHVGWHVATHPEARTKA